MKKLLISTLTIGLFLIGGFGNLYATPLLNDDGSDGFEDIAGSPYAYYVNSGEFMFFKEGNNDGINFNDGTVEGYVEDWLALQGFSWFDPTTFELTLAGSGNVSYSSYDNNSGTWDVTPATNVIRFYAVKAGNAYAMYFVDPADYEGSWSTYDVYVNGGHPGGELEISHFTGYNQTNTEVPEPATMLLFGAGLAGLASSRLRQKK